MTRLFLILTVSLSLPACNQTATRNKQAALNDSTTDKFIEKYLSDTSSRSTISKSDSKCHIDTSAILTNKNLQALIDKLEKTDLTTHKIVKEIPDFLMDFLDCTSGRHFSMANPGEDWQVGCVRMEKTIQKKIYDKKKKDTLIEMQVMLDDLPDRQLIYFGLGNDIALLTFYTGGIGKSEHILIFQFQDKEVIDFWCGNILTYLSDKKEIVEYLQRNKDIDWGLNTNIIYF